MIIRGKQIILRDKMYDSDFEDYLRWWNLEEWQYFDAPDEPFQPITREDFQKKWDFFRNRPPSKKSKQWQVEDL